MSVAPDIRTLKRRLDRFFWDNDTSEAVRLRALLKENFGHFKQVGIVGGLVRDFARGGRGAFKSDVDLVIVADAVEVERTARNLGAHPNRFGGFGYYMEPWHIDFWALSRTWAAVQGHASVGDLRDVTRCVFFDWDAIAYDIGSRRVLCERLYLDRIRDRRLEISLRANPSIMGNLLRAVRRIIRWDVEPGPQLRLFLEEHLNATSFSDLRDTEQRKHSDHVFMEYHDVVQLRWALFHPEARQPSREQLALDL